MSLRPVPGTSGERLAALLIDAENALRNVQGAGTSSYELYNAYLNWSSAQIRMLGPAVTQETLDVLITTRRHWALHALDPAAKGPALSGLVTTEIEQQVRVIASAREQLTDQMRQYDGVDLILIPDTNVYLHSRATFDMVDWHETVADSELRLRVLVPLLVIDELDRAKRRKDPVDGNGKTSIRTRARVTLKAMEELLTSHQGARRVRGASFDLLAERPGHTRLPDPDSELVDQARSLSDLSGVPVAIITSDTGMRVRASANGVDARPTPSNWRE